MRRAQLDMTNQVREASAEEWVGALMHELAHALGFAGHAGAGDSILVRDETRIRALGRLALRGDAVPEETLEVAESDVEPEVIKKGKADEEGGEPSEKEGKDKS